MLVFDSSKIVTGIEKVPTTGKNCNYLSSDKKGYDVIYNLKNRLCKQDIT